MWQYTRIAIPHIYLLQGNKQQLTMTSPRFVELQKRTCFQTCTSLTAVHNVCSDLSQWCRRFEMLSHHLVSTDEYRRDTSSKQPLWQNILTEEQHTHLHENLFSDLTYRTHYAPTTSILSSSWNQHTSPVYHTNRPRKRHHQSLSTI